MTRASREVSTALLAPAYSFDMRRGLCGAIMTPGLLAKKAGFCHFSFHVKAICQRLHADDEDY